MEKRKPVFLKYLPLWFHIWKTKMAYSEFIVLKSKIVFLFSCSDWLINICRRKKELKARTVWLGCPEKCEEKYPKNAIKNQKYNIFTFIPGVRLLVFWYWTDCMFCSIFVCSTRRYIYVPGFFIFSTLISMSLSTAVSESKATFSWSLYFQRHIYMRNVCMSWVVGIQWSITNLRCIRNLESPSWNNLLNHQLWSH